MALLGPAARRAGTCLVAFWAVAVAARGTPVQRTSTAEDDVKATFLFNFTKFVDWPAPPPGAEPFRVCVVAEPAFAASVDRIIAGETAQGRPLQRVTPTAPDAARTCQILFLGRSEAAHADRWIAAVRNTPVLLVGESPDFCDRGGHINFVLDDNHVRFDVNQDSASRAGIEISSKLLRIARSVTPRRTQ